MLTHRSVSLVCALAVGAAIVPRVGPVWAQPPAAPKVAPKAAPRAVPKAAPKGKTKAKDAPPEPEEVKLETKDGWTIHATYFPGTKKKEAIPFILLHGWEGQRGEYDGLAGYLQAQGHAIIAPDLRGHGQSTTRRGGKEVESPDDLKKADLEGTVWDVEACKKFLRLENNKGECNIEALCIVAAEYSSIIGMVWSAEDWNHPPLASYKNGQDVKALVLLSPWQSYKGITLQKALQHPAIKTKLSIMIVAGTEDSRGFADAKKLNTSIEAFRPDMKKKDVPDEERTIVLVTPETSLSGTGLLNEGLRLDSMIGFFVKNRLVDRLSSFEWSERVSPLESQ